MSEIEISKELEKDQVFNLVEKFLTDLGLSIDTRDMNRPWGGFFVLNENHIRRFKELFFPSIELSEAQLNQKLSPKFLIVSPDARLSWQYHFRRSELWNLVGGKASLSRSQSDVQGTPEMLERGNVVFLEKGERHRLIGEDTWGIVAEIWVHSDPNHPSDESDIVRLEDDYSRN
jgi:mannose-6-phosphate isomerase